MKRYRAVFALLFFIFIFGQHNDVFAGFETVKIPFEEGKWLTVEISIKGVEITNVIMVLPGGKGMIHMPKGNDPVARVNLKNSSDIAMSDICVAIALLDEDDRLLGVSSGKERKIPPDQIREITLPFHYVNTNFSKASHILISMEIDDS